MNSEVKEQSDGELCIFLFGNLQRYDVIKSLRESVLLVRMEGKNRWDQMLAVMVLSQHRLSSSKTVRPATPQGARCKEHVEIVWSAV